MNRYKIGIIGVGKLGAYHCNVINRLEQVTFSGVFDSDKDRKKEIASKYNCIAYDTVENLIENVDIVGVIVPTQYHYEVVKKVIASGKPVFVEKPLTSTIEQAQEIVNFVSANKVAAQVGHIERYNPAIRALENYNLTPMFIESHRLSPFDPRGTDVAVILDLMIHDIDIILSIVKSKIKDVYANGVAIVSDEVDIANARLQFENGCVANVTASRISQKKMRKMRLFQKDAYISIDFLLRLTEVFRLGEKDEKPLNAVNLGHIDKGKHKRNIIYEKPIIPEEDAMTQEWIDFLNAIENNKKPTVSVEDGLEALKVALLIREKIEKS